MDHSLNSLASTIFFIVTNNAVVDENCISDFYYIITVHVYVEMKAHSHTFQEWLHIYGHRSQPFPVWLRFSGPLEPPGKPLHCFCKIEKNVPIIIQS